MLAESFAKQDNIRVIQLKDDIRQPKANGYHSLYRVLETPIFLHAEKKTMKGGDAVPYAVHGSEGKSGA